MNRGSGVNSESKLQNRRLFKKTGVWVWPIPGALRNSAECQTGRKAKP